MIPSWLTKPLQLLPTPLTATTLGVILNIFFRRYPELGERLAEMNGKLLEFDVEDLGQRFFMTVDGAEVRVHTYSDLGPDVTMAGNANAFLALLFQTEDPDSLFFSRELKLSGETDTGLRFKNLLANVEIDWERELTSALGWPLAKLLLASSGYFQNVWRSGKTGMSQTANEWMADETTPRQSELEAFRTELAELTKATDQLEGGISRAAKRLALAQNARRRQTELPSGAKPATP